MSAPPPPRFRNVVVDGDTPVAAWPFEAVQTVIDRGSLTDWRLLAAEIRRAPWGRVARAVWTITGWDEQPGVDATMRAVIEHARRDVVDEGRSRWAAHIRALRASTGLTMREFASLAGTSASRLSDYENARVAPTSDALARLDHAAQAAISDPGSQSRRGPAHQRQPPASTARAGPAPPTGDRTDRGGGQRGP